MNTHISRINAIDDQLKRLDRVASEGVYLGAGLSIQVTVGPPSEGQSPDLDIGLCNNLPEILDALKGGLQQARAERMSMAKADLKELQSFLEQEGN